MCVCVGLKGFCVKTQTLDLVEEICKTHTFHSLLAGWNSEVVFPIPAPPPYHTKVNDNMLFVYRNPAYWLILGLCHENVVHFRLNPMLHVQEIRGYTLRYMCRRFEAIYPVLNVQEIRDYTLRYLCRRLKAIPCVSCAGD